MRSLPLSDGDPAQPIAFHRGAYVTRAAFMTDVLHWAERLPERRHVFNRCTDRYLFLVGFAAAMLRKQITVCPAAATASHVNFLRESFPDIYAIVDEGDDPQLLSVRLACTSAQAEGRVAEIDRDQPVLLAFTSGSTGRPAQHLKTWGALIEGMRRQIAMLGIVASSPRTVIATVPPQHMYGFESSLLMPLLSGDIIYGGKPFFPHDIERAFARSQTACILVTTPFHLRACVESHITLRGVEFILSATAPLSANLAREAERRFATRVLEVYGCTETGSIATRRPAQQTSWRLHDGLDLTKRGDIAFVTGAHAAEPTPLNDIVHKIDERNFALAGRIGDMVNVAGKRASLAELTRILTAIDGVKDGVFFVPEHTQGDIVRLAAFAVAPQRDAQEILTLLRDKIDAAFLPRPLHLLETLPRNETGKLPIERLNALLNAETSTARFCA